MKILQIVVFSPCHGLRIDGEHNGCTRYVADEWWGETKDTAYHDKRQNVRQFDDVEQGLDYYRDKMPGEMVVTRYNSKLGKYEGSKEDSNVSVTGSHTICRQCKEALHEIRDRDRNSV